jgi:energy-converting hydrogenase Eha subunit A
MKAFVAALVVAIVVAIVAGVLLNAGEKPSRDAFQTTSGSVRLDP